jgi:hypothetical protein
MAGQRKRPKAGDILELKIGDRFAYLQYIGRHSQYGDAVLVKRGLHDQQTPQADVRFAGAYVTFYPVTAAAAHGLVEVVGHLPPPEIPTRLRRAGARSGGRVRTWIIESSSGDVVKTHLSEEDLRLPIAAIWNHELLVQRIAEGWNPAHDGPPSMSCK